MFKTFFLDFSTNNQYGFQDPATPIMEGIIDLHHYIFFFLVVICIFVIWLMFAVLYRFWFKRYIYTRQSFINGGYTGFKLYIWSVFLVNSNFRSKFKALRLMLHVRGWCYFLSSLFDCPTHDILFLRRISHYYRSFLAPCHMTICYLINSQQVQRLRQFYQYILYLRILNRRKFLDILNETRAITHGVVLEIVWTVLPSFILIFIAVPSFILLYSIDEMVLSSNSIVLKAIGNQWFWTYEVNVANVPDINDFNDNDSLKNLNLAINHNLIYDSYMIPTEELEEGALRLLAVDRELFIPMHTHVKILVTSRDVLHSWAVPSLGIKVDAVPGRLNACSAYIKRSGVFYGQCSEICGVNHAFMPIVVKTIPEYSFGLIERF